MVGRVIGRVAVVGRPLRSSSTEGRLLSTGLSQEVRPPGVAAGRPPHAGSRLRSGKAHGPPPSAASPCAKVREAVSRRCRGRASFCPCQRSPKRHYVPAARWHRWPYRALIPRRQCSTAWSSLCVVHSSHATRQAARQPPPGHLPPQPHLLARGQDAQVPRPSCDCARTSWRKDLTRTRLPKRRPRPWRPPQAPLAHRQSRR